MNFHQQTPYLSNKSLKHNLFALLSVGRRGISFTIQKPFLLSFKTRSIFTFIVFIVFIGVLLLFLFLHIISLHSLTNLLHSLSLLPLFLTLLLLGFLSFNCLSVTFIANIYLLQQGRIILLSNTIRSTQCSIPFQVFSLFLEISPHNDFLLKFHNFLSSS